MHVDIGTFKLTISVLNFEHLIICKVPDTFFCIQLNYRFTTAVAEYVQYVICMQRQTNLRRWCVTKFWVLLNFTRNLQPPSQFQLIFCWLRSFTRRYLLQLIHVFDGYYVIDVTCLCLVTGMVRRTRCIRRRPASGIGRRANGRTFTSTGIIVVTSKEPVGPRVE